MSPPMSCRVCSVQFEFADRQRWTVTPGSCPLGCDLRQIDMLCSSCVSKNCRCSRPLSPRPDLGSLQRIDPLEAPDADVLSFLERCGLQGVGSLTLNDGVQLIQRIDRKGGAARAQLWKGSYRGEEVGKRTLECQSKAVHQGLLHQSQIYCR